MMSKRLLHLIRPNVQTVMRQILVDLHARKSRAPEQAFEFLAGIDGHAVDNLQPLLMTLRLAARLICNHKHTAGLQYAVHLCKATCNLRPEIHRLERRHNIEPTIIKRQLQYIPPPAPKTAPSPSPTPTTVWPPPPTPSPARSCPTASKAYCW